MPYVEKQKNYLKIVDKETGWEGERLPDKYMVGTLIKTKFSINIICLLISSPKVGGSCNHKDDSVLKVH